jgi:hypothetical protein
MQTWPSNELRNVTFLWRKFVSILCVLLYILKLALWLYAYQFCANFFHLHFKTRIYDDVHAQRRFAWRHARSEANFARFCWLFDVMLKAKKDWIYNSMSTFIPLTKENGRRIILVTGNTSCRNTYKPSAFHRILQLNFNLLWVKQYDSKFVK